jgi:hypothetical protein
MRRAKREQEKLNSILRQAYQEKEKLEVGEPSRDEILRRIRQLGVQVPSPRFLPLFEQLVWRLAPVTCLFIFLLLALIAVIPLFDGSSGYDVFQQLSNEKEELTWVQMFEA